METVVVDNGSADGSPGLVSELFPWVRVIALETNRGFAAAVNAGILSTGGRFVALLNNDTELDSRWLEHLLRALSTHPEAGSAASLMLDFTRRDRIDSAGDMLSRSGVPLARGYGKTLGTEYRQPGFVFGACAGAALYRRTLFDTVGLFDEAFISYLEDADLAFRAQIGGIKCIFVPEAICYHKRGATARKLSGFSARMLERNLILLYAKNIPARLLPGLIPIIVGARFRHVIRSFKSRTATATLKGLIQGLMMIPRMLPARSTVQECRKVEPDRIRQMLGREIL
jgi:GT2 family glycosyltransferase